MIALQIALVASMIFAPYAGQDSQEPKERRVHKPAVGVDFTCHSHVDKTSDHKFTLNHFIKNNSSSPLSVEWKEAGIICVGMSQLPPGYTDSGSSGRVIDSPALVETNIRYGVKLNYRAPAQVYIDPQPTASSGRRQVIETTYERRNEKNELVFSIQVVSELNSEDQSAQLTFRIYGGLSLALAADGRRESNDGFLQGFMQPGEFGFGDKSVDTAMRRWFKFSGGANFLVLKNTTSDPIEFTTTFEHGTFEGVLALKEIHLVAFEPNQKGFVGLAARAYVPTSLPVK
jgi:hypothetical protein